jgi:ribose transport system permease protein
VLLLLAGVALTWMVIKRTPFGRSMYAVGGDFAAATACGIRVRWVSLGAYSLAGTLYGLAGVVLTAESASGDPNVGTPLVLSVFAAVVIGGVVFGGGRGDVVGAMLGAYIIYLVANILFVLGVTASYTNVVNGLVLLLAVLLTSIGGTRFVMNARRRLRSAAPTAGEVLR